MDIFKLRNFLLSEIKINNPLKEYEKSLNTLEYNDKDYDELMDTFGEDIADHIYMIQDLDKFFTKKELEEYLNSEWNGSYGGSVDDFIKFLLKYHIVNKL